MSATHGLHWARIHNMNRSSWTQTISIQYIHDLCVTISYVHAPNTVKRYSELRIAIPKSKRAPFTYWVLPASRFDIRKPRCRFWSSMATQCFLLSLALGWMATCLMQQFLASCGRWIFQRLFRVSQKETHRAQLQGLGIMESHQMWW